jgi:hypothetical protein
MTEQDEKKPQYSHRVPAKIQTTPAKYRSVVLLFKLTLFKLPSSEQKSVLFYNE